MSATDLERLRAIKTFPQLVKYLREDLDWPINTVDFDELTFDYSPEELGLDLATAVKIKEIKQLRPLSTNQPWGIFFLNFEPKTLPVVVLRRILQKLVIKKRASANKPQMRAWNLHDLLFISSYGESDDRSITFAHFSEDSQASELPSLRVLGWDNQDTVLHLDDAHKTLTEKLHWPKSPDDFESWRNEWSEAFTLRYREVIATSRDLAIQLAHLARRIRKRVNAILKVESDKGPFKQLHHAFREALIHDLNEDDFADMYAQTITYGLLAARVSRPMGIISQNLADLVTNPFLKETLGTFLAYGGRKGKIDFDEAGILDVVELLNSPDTHIEAVLRDFGNRTQREDPVIHFYELFLTEYDNKKKVERGVFYTPQPVVSYIVRSVHELLQTEFGLEDGLASTITWGEMAKKNKDINIPKGVSPEEPFVQILDPAVGTGTFLVEVIDVVAKTMISKWQKGGRSQNEIQKLWDDYVGKHLLRRLYGYELMMAPYVIADIKLTLKLTEISRQLGELFYHAEGKGRFNIYLTNSLEPPSQAADEKLADLFLPLAHEAKSVNDIKREKRFTVVIGNPPYSGRSYNLTEYARGLVEKYKFIGEDRIKEKGALQLEKNLNDDYIKFICFSQTYVGENHPRLVGMISNNSFLENPTLRGMRWSLVQDNAKINVLDLHGNAARKEVGQGGERDENVFDITQGVAITLLCSKLSKSECEVNRVDLLGTRERKYDLLSSRSFTGIGPSLCDPASPFFLFAVQSSTVRDEFYSYDSIVDIMPLNSTGVKTHRDEYCIDFDYEALQKRIEELKDEKVSDSTIRQKYGLPDTYGWDLRTCRKRLRNDKNWRGLFTKIVYRPFDERDIFYSPYLVELPRFEVMKNLVGRKNIGLIFMRQVAVQQDYSHFGVSKHPVDNRAFYSNRGTMSLAPLFVFKEDQLDKGEKDEPLANVSSSFKKRLQNQLGVELCSVKKTGAITPKELLCYFYGMFHSASFRKRYADFLKGDFPRVPLTSGLELFDALAKHGSDLVDLHLMESPKLEKHITKFVGKKIEVEKVTYCINTVWIDKAQTSGFRGISENVWEFHIGGYQVCEKWLKDRKGRKLSKEDIEQYHRIVVALNETICIMGEIDKVIDEHGGWPIK